MKVISYILDLLVFIITMFVFVFVSILVAGFFEFNNVYCIIAGVSTWLFLLLKYAKKKTTKFFKNKGVGEFQKNEDFLEKYIKTLRIIMLAIILIFVVCLIYSFAVSGFAFSNLIAASVMIVIMLFTSKKLWIND